MARKGKAGSVPSLEFGEADIAELHPHPRNWRSHPDDQVEHIMESIRENGVYRNVLVARDGTILAGHGVVEAARRLGLASVPVARLDIAPDDPRALKVMVGDHGTQHLAETDDRILADILKDVMELDGAGLLGTGYDEMMLANLVFVTRPSSEVQDFDEAAHWAGMPEYQSGEGSLSVVVHFRDEDDLRQFAEMLGLEIHGSAEGVRTRSAWWPPKRAADLVSLKFTG